MEHSQNWTWKIGITSERLLECYALQEYHFCSSTVVRMSRFQPFFFALQTSTQWAWSLTRPRWSCSETRWSGSARPRPRLHTPCTGWRCAPSPPPSPSCLFMEKWLVSKSREHLWTSACRDFSFLCFFCNIPRLRFLKHKHHPSWKLRPLMAPYLALCFSGSTLKPVFFFFFFLPLQFLPFWLACLKMCKHDPSTRLLSAQLLFNSGAVGFVGSSHSPVMQTASYCLSHSCNPKCMFNLMSFCVVFQLLAADLISNSHAVFQFASLPSRYLTSVEHA